MDCSGAEDSALVGSFVCNNSSDSRRLLVGKVASFDEASKLYGVVYEDRHREELDQQQVRQVLMVEDHAPGSSIRLTCKKRKLEQLVASFSGDLKMPALLRSKKNISDVSDRVLSSSNCRTDFDLSEDADSSCNSCDYQRDSSSSIRLELQVLELPPSSGDIPVPDGSISHLFSVYNFLRSFSVQLFLSPFTFDDFVGSLDCMSQNLFDAIHISLMQTLMRHLQMLSSEGSALASKCLRYHDWSLIDALTWPVFLVEYLYVMGYMKSFWDEFRDIFSNQEYYGLSVETKLKVLQILCDDAIDSAELRIELESRESIEEMEDILGSSIPQESQSSTLPIISFNAYGNGSSDALHDTNKFNKPTPKLENKELGIEVSKDATDGNSDECSLCGMDGTLICCDGCPIS